MEINSFKMNTAIPIFQIYNGLNGTLCNTNITEPVLCINQLESLESESDLLKVEPDERYILPFWFFNYTDTSNDKLLFNTNSYRPFFSKLFLTVLS